MIFFIFSIFMFFLLFFIFLYFLFSHRFLSSHFVIMSHALSPEEKEKVDRAIAETLVDMTQKAVNQGPNTIELLERFIGLVKSANLSDAAKSLEHVRKELDAYEKAMKVLVLPVFALHATAKTVCAKKIRREEETLEKECAAKRQKLKKDNMPEDVKQALQCDVDKTQHKLDKKKDLRVMLDKIT